MSENYNGGTSFVFSSSRGAPALRGSCIRYMPETINPLDAKCQMFKRSPPESRAGWLCELLPNSMLLPIFARSASRLLPLSLRDVTGRPARTDRALQ